MKIAVDYNPHEDETARWGTTCEEHGYIMGHATRKLAVWHSADPTGWCEACEKLFDDRMEREDVT